MDKLPHSSDNNILYTCKKLENLLLDGQSIQNALECIAEYNTKS